MPDGSIKSFNADRMWTGGVMINANGSVLSSGEGSPANKNSFLFLTLSETAGMPIETTKFSLN